MSSFGIGLGPEKLRAGLSEREGGLDLPEVEENLPAMQTLRSQQRDLLDEFSQGFGSRREVLDWGRRVGVYTLGEFDSDALDRLINSKNGLGILIGPRYYPSGSKPLRPHEEVAVREAILAVEMIPAVIASMKRMRFLAVQYDLRTDARPDSEGQRHPGMRPLLSEINDRQEYALEGFLDGFEDLSEFREWILWAVEATWAELDPAFPDRVLSREPRLASILVEESEESERVRETLASKYLLPAFSKAVTTAASSAAEVSERTNRVGRQPIG